MRTILTLGALIIFYVSADAAPVRHSRRIKHRPRSEHAITAPDARKSFTVPGWTDEETQKWLDDATRMVGRGA
jgi:hypothetical protein